MKAEAKVGVEIFEFSDVAGTGQPGVEILVSTPNRHRAAAGSPPVDEHPLHLCCCCCQL